MCVDTRISLDLRTGEATVDDEQMDGGQKREEPHSGGPVRHCVAAMDLPVRARCMAAALNGERPGIPPIGRSLKARRRGERLERARFTRREGSGVLPRPLTRSALVMLT